MAAETPAARALRHYLYQRRVRPIDCSHLGERSAPGARHDRLTATPAAQALRVARYRIEASDALSATQPDVAADYDATGGV